MNLNIEYLKNYMKRKFEEGYEGYEIVVALLTLVKEKKIEEKDILPIISYVYNDNSIAVYNALNKARELADDKLIEDIIKEMGGINGK
jgi:hypothetical protein